MKLASFLAVVRSIPRGEVMTYGDVARAAGHPGAARQVVWALRQSDPSIPWHRVVGAGLRIRLPAEAGWEQRLRLEAEGWQVARSGTLRRLEQKLDAELKPARTARAQDSSKSR